MTTAKGQLMHYLKYFLQSVLVVVMLVLTGCGGDGGGGEGTAIPSVISGTASHGAPLAAGSTVYLKDANGIERTTAVVGGNGSYSITIDGLSAPFILEAGNYYSFSTGAGTVNINPFTHLCMESVLGVTDLAAFYGMPTAESLNTLAAKYKPFAYDMIAKLDTLYPTTVPSSQRDFLNGTIVIGQGVDRLFENIEIMSTPSTVTITNKGQSSVLMFVTNDVATGTVTISKNDDAFAILNNVLYPKTAAVHIVASGSNSYSIQAQNMDGIAAIQLDITYDTSSMATPTVTQGSIVSGAMLAANTTNPGVIRIAIISTGTFSGSGQVASISFGSKTGSNGITSITTSMFDIMGASVPATASNESINPEGAKIQVVSSGSGVCLINANDITGVAGIQLDITYDATSLSSPLVTQGWLVSGAMMVTNTSTPGKIKIAIISTNAFSGSGQVAAISFAAVTGSGGIISISSSMINSSGAQITSTSSI
jgi:hypothetical protein